ncbi:ABC transporter permease [Agromyces bauzanensis]
MSTDPRSARLQGVFRRIFPPGSLRTTIIKRLAVLPFILLGIVAIVFLLNRLVPGDPAVVYAGGEQADPVMVEQLRQEWGLDLSLPEQFVRYVGQLVQGDLGWSFSQHKEVVDVLAAKTPATLELAASALLLGVPAGFALGVSSARKQGGFTDHVATTLAIVGISMPLFWFGLMLVYVFSVQLGWFPVSGRIPAFSTFRSITGFNVLDSIITMDASAFGSTLRHLVLPAVTLAIAPAAVMARFARSSFLDVLGENYIRTARAFGLGQRTIIWKLAAKNAVLPLINLLGLIIPSLIVGAVLVEIVFSWPGLGRFLFDALLARDYVIVQSVTLLVGLLYVILNLAADLSHALLDPRTRRS